MEGSSSSGGGGVEVAVLLFEEVLDVPVVEAFFAVDDQDYLV